MTVPHLQRTLGVALSTPQRAVDQLQQADVLVRAGEGQRNRVWITPEVIDALDAFAERAGRRG